MRCGACRAELLARWVDHVPEHDEERPRYDAERAEVELVAASADTTGSRRPRAAR